MSPEFLYCDFEVSVFLTIRDKAPLLAHINFNSSLKPSSQGREMDRRLTRVTV